MVKLTKNCLDMMGTSAPPAFSGIPIAAKADSQAEVPIMSEATFRLLNASNPERLELICLDVIGGLNT